MALSPEDFANAALLAGRMSAREPFVIVLDGLLEVDRMAFLNELDAIFHEEFGGELVFLETPGGTVHVDYAG